MLEAAGRLSFPEKTLQLVRIIREILGHHLDRHRPVQEWIVALVNHTHPAAPDDVENVVLPDFRRRSKGHTNPRPLARSSDARKLLAVLLMRVPPFAPTLAGTRAPGEDESVFNTVGSYCATNGSSLATTT